MCIVLYLLAGPDKSSIDQVLNPTASFCTDLRLDAIPVRREIDPWISWGAATSNGVRAALGYKEMRYALQQFERHVSKLVFQADEFVKSRFRQ